MGDIDDSIDFIVEEILNTYGDGQGYLNFPQWQAYIFRNG